MNADFWSDFSCKIGHHLVEIFFFFFFCSQKAPYYAAKLHLMFPYPIRCVLWLSNGKWSRFLFPCCMLWQDFWTRFPPASVALSTLFQRGSECLPLFSHLQGREHRNCWVSIGGSFQPSWVENTGTPAVGALHEWQDGCWKGAINKAKLFREAVQQSWVWMSATSLSPLGSADSCQALTSEPKRALESFMWGCNH